ncbi:MAG: hypothetical protein Q4F31_02515 [Eubacteriales bacterium]|nr:hypothetical protein [Eubacteriales bacterium]
MIDFHSHILPGIDDGADTPETAYEMLCMSAQQGVKKIVATPHYYPAEESPEAFLRRREEAVNKLKVYVLQRREHGDKREVPSVYLGAEVYYFPTLGTCESLRRLAFGHDHFLLVEPPMSSWTESMFDEIALAEKNFGVVPVIAHVDRYARLLKDNSLFEEVDSRGFLVQVNASFFTRRETQTFAFELLSDGMIHMLGSDAHDLEYRKPNLADAVTAISRRGLGSCLDHLIAL